MLILLVEYRFFICWFEFIYYYLRVEINIGRVGYGLVR